MPDSSTRRRSDAAATQRWVERLERFAARNQTVDAFRTPRASLNPTSICDGVGSPNSTRCPPRPARWSSHSTSNPHPRPRSS